MDKKCIKCGETKSTDDFFPKSGRVNQFSSYCKTCFSEYRKQYYLDNIEKEKENQVNWTAANKDMVIAKNKRFNELNPNWRNEYQVKYVRERCKIDPNFKIIIKLRTRINKACKGFLKVGSAVEDLGCSIAKLKIHLQLQFTRNPRGKHEYMTWDNHGRKGWHIDHIKPLASFDLSDRKQFLDACHYTNLQPLWAIDNLKKGDKI